MSRFEEQKKSAVETAQNIICGAIESNVVRTWNA